MHNKNTVHSDWYPYIKPNVPCKHPGCPALVRYGKKYCDKHAPLHVVYRPSANKRGYGSKWQKARKIYLKTHPLCVACMKEGRYVKATDVDHVIPHRGDQKLFWDRNNWQALCHSCHSKKTARENRERVYTY